MEDYEEVSSNKVKWKSFFSGGLVLLLCSSYSIRCSWAVSYLTRKYDRKGTDEDVPIGKHIAYLVDVLFSTHSYAKAVCYFVADWVWGLSTLCRW